MGDNVNENKEVAPAIIEKIEIKNLGPVKSWNAEFSNINFFIGPNGTGKSYVCMAIYSMLHTALKHEKDIEQKLIFVFQEKNIKNKLISWKEASGYVIAYINNKKLSLYLEKRKKPVFNTSGSGLSSLNYKINFISMPDLLNVYSAINIFSKEYSGSLGVSDIITDFLASLLNLEYPAISRQWEDVLKKIEKKINARYSIDKGKIIVSFKNEKVNIERVSSGFKTFSLIYLALKQGIISPHGIVFIEEPEEHLHPEWQVIMAELLIEIGLKGTQVFVSTHSDYLLKKINNILQNPGQAHLKSKIKAFLFTGNGIPKELETDSRGIDLLPLLDTYYKLYEEGEAFL